MHITKWKKPIWEGCTLYNSNYYKTFWKIENYGDSPKDQWLPLLARKEAWIGETQRIFREVELSAWWSNGKYMSLKCVQTHRYANYGLWVIMVCQKRSICWSKWTTLGGDALGDTLQSSVLEDTSHRFTPSIQWCPPSPSPFVSAISHEECGLPRSSNIWWPQPIHWPLLSVTHSLL